MHHPSPRATGVLQVPLRSGVQLSAAEELIYDVEDDPLYVAVRGEP